MKVLLILLFLSCYQLMARQNPQGIVFFDGTITEAMAKAKKENKALFLDCFTSWCGPCRYMQQKVFSTREVGDFMNTQLICIKMDMEKGEGQQWAKKLKIDAYPTFIIFSPDGKEQHRMIGRYESKEFMDKIKEGLELKTSTSYRDYCYRQGERSPGFLRDYIQQLIDFKQDSVAKTIIAEIFSSVPDSLLQSESYWWLFTNKEISPFDSKSFNYMIKHQDEFIRSHGDTINRLIIQKVENIIGTYIGWFPLKGDYNQQYYRTVCRVDNFIAKTLPENKALKAETELLKARFLGNLDDYIAVFRKHIWLVPPQNIPNAYSGLAFCAVKTKDPEKINEVIVIGLDIKSKLTDIRLQDIMDRIFAKIKSSQN